MRYLWNDCENAQAYSDSSKRTARQLCSVASAGKGDANHGVNDICNSIYSDTISMLDAYYNAAQTVTETLKVVESIMYFPIGFVLKPKLNSEYFNLMTEIRKIPENFINSVNNKQNEYIEDEPVNIKFAETGER